MSEYFPKPESLGANVKVELDSANYAINATGVNTSGFAKNIGLPNLKSDEDKLDIDKLKNVPSSFSSLKSKVDKLDIGKLETTPVDLSKLSDVLETEAVKTTDYKKLV